jgi:hypothetical protein
VLTEALPTDAVETVAVCELRRVGVMACNWVLRVPKLVPKAPRVVLVFVRFVSSVWRFVIGMLSAAIIEEIIDETFKPLKVPPIVILIKPLDILSIGMRDIVLNRFYEIQPARKSGPIRSRSLLKNAIF